MSNEVTIAIDTREQAPLSGFTLPSVRATLKTGDYSVVGAEHLFAVERKTVSDLIGTLTTGRERFERELVRLSEMRRACIVVEGDLDTIIGWRYRSKVSPACLVGSFASFFARFGVATVFAGSVRNAEILARAFLVKAEKHLGAQDAA